jgi:hypothetical protein
MATTTTNFGWDIPQSTDLVKDGATAIATLGQDIDTAMVDLKGGTSGQVLAKASGTDLDFTWVAQDDSNAIQNAIVDAKGDLIAATANDTPARLAVGTNGQVLTADSTASTGIKWATPASNGGMTQLGSTTTLSGASTTITFDATGYNEIQVIVQGITTTPNTDYPRIDINGTSGITDVAGVYQSTAAYSNGNIYMLGGAYELKKDGGLNSWVVHIYQPASTSYYKPVTSTSAGQDYASADRAASYGGHVKTSSAISSIKVTCINAGNSFNGGQVRIYGVK